MRQNEWGINALLRDSLPPFHSGFMHCCCSPGVYSAISRVCWHAAKTGLCQVLLIALNNHLRIDVLF